MKHKFFLIFFLFPIFLSCVSFNSSLTNKSSRILIVYDSVYGSTKLIAHWIAQGIEENINEQVIKVVPITQVQVDEELKWANFILLGSPIYRGDISDRMKGFIKKYSSEIKRRPFGIFVVCGTYLIHEERLLDNFEKTIGKNSNVKKAFGGRLNPEKLIPEHHKRLNDYWKERGVNYIKSFDYLSKDDAIGFGRKIKDEIIR